MGYKRELGRERVKEREREREREWIKYGSIRAYLKDIMMAKAMSRENRETAYPVDATILMLAT